MKSFFAWLVCALVAGIGVTGCSSSNDTGGTSGTPTGGTAYKGTFAGKGEGGSIDVNVAAASTTAKSLRILATLQVTGTLKLTGGATSSITGTYDDVTKTLTITGGGYTFTGTLGTNGISGSYSGPNGSGTFSVLSGAGSKAYCGTYGVGAATSGAGVWNFTINGATLVGGYSGVDGKGGGLTGTVTGDKVDIKTDGNTATGTITGDTATGTYQGGAWTGKGC